MALTTATTSVPCRRVRAMWSATARIRSASPTEVPPNFWTTNGIRTRLQTAHGRHPRQCGPRSPPAHSRPAPPRPRPTRWAIRGGPGDWVGSRAVPSDKRARQRAAREARLAAEAKQKKRRRQIRNGVLVVVIAGVIVGIVFAVSGGSNGSKSTATTTTAAGQDAGRRQAAGPGQRGRGQGRLPGLADHPHRGSRAEVHGGAAHDDRHVQGVHGHDHHHDRDLHDCARRQGRARHGQQLRVPGRQGLLQLRELLPGDHGPVVQTGNPAQTNTGKEPGYTIPDELPAKAANPAQQYPAGTVAMAKRARPTPAAASSSS